MVLPFDQFLRQVLQPGSGIPGGLVAQPTPGTPGAPGYTPDMMAQQYPVTAPPPAATPPVTTTQATPPAQVPIQQRRATPPMDYASFVSQQGSAIMAAAQSAGQQANNTVTRYSGTWQTVQYQYGGVSYTILMPIENTANLPEGANLIGDPIVNEPNRVARAVEAGQQGQQGQSFSGILDQMPEEIQAVFRSSQDVYEVSQNRPLDPIEEKTPDEWAAEDAALAEQQATQTTQPDNGVADNYTSEMVDQGQVMRDVQAYGVDATVAREAAKEPLTTEELRQTDPVKAAMLEEAGIFEVGAGQMVIRNAEGELRIVNAQETAPGGTEIITYGGHSPRTPERDFGGPLDWAGTVLNLFEIPQRATQGAGSWVNDQVADYIPEWAVPIVNQFISAGVPAGDYGMAGFHQWMLANPEEADAARRNGFNGFTGERAVWERWQSERNTFERFMDSLLSDPSIFTATGAGGAVRRVGEEVATVPGMRLFGQAIDEIGRVAEVPEQLLNEVTDAAVGAIRPIGRAIQHTPIGRIFDQTEETVFRNEVEDARTAIDDIVAQTPVSPGQSPLPASQVPTPGQAVSPSVAPNPAAIPTPGVAPSEGQLPPPTDRPIVPEEAAPLSVDRSIDDLANPSAANAASPDLVAPSVPGGLTVQPGTLPGTWRVLDETGKPIPELQNVSRDYIERWYASPRAGRPLQEAQMTEPDVPSPLLRADREFQVSKQGQMTEKEIAKWPEWIRPQTAEDRVVGRNRFGVDFEPRPQDVARAMASELPDKWVGFMREYGRRLNAKTGLVAKEAARQSDRSWAPLRSERFGNMADGFELKRVHEVMIEADHYIHEAGPIFNKYFAEDAELPSWSWKRWGSGGNQHTALDTLAENGGRYRPGTDLAEATELAIFHPDELVRESAWLDVVRRIGLKEDSGKIKYLKDGPMVHPRIRPELKNIFATSRRESLPALQRDYQELLRLNEQNGVQFPDRLTIDDAKMLSRQINQIPESEAAQLDPVGAAIFERDLAAGQVADQRLANEEAIFEQDYQRTLQQDAAQIDPAGAAVFERDLAAGALRDVPEQVANQPLALGARTATGLDAIPAIPMPAPGQQLMPPGAVPTPSVGSVAPGPVPTTQMDQFIGPRDPRQQATAIRQIQQARQQSRELTRAEVGSPGGNILQRADARIGEAIEGFDERIIERSRLRREATGEGRAAARRQAAVLRVPNQQDIQSFTVRGRIASKDQLETLMQTFDDTGETILERWDRYTLEELEAAGDDAVVAIAEQRASQRALADFAEGILPENARGRYRSELVRAKKNTIIDEATGKERPMTDLEAQFEALERTGNRFKQDGKVGFWRKYDRIMSALRKTFLYNWLTGVRYVATQLVGNTVTAGVTHHFDVAGDILNPAEMRRAYQAAHTLGATPPSVMNDVLSGYGLGGARMLTRGTASVRDQTLESAANQSLKQGNSLLGKWTVPLADRRIRDTAGWFDTRAREALYARWMDTNLAVARSNLRERMIASMPQGPIEGAGQTVAQRFDALPTRFSASDIREQFGEYGQTWADRHARDWQEAITKTDRGARDEVKRVFFTGDERNIDVALKRVLFFHYWMSRATPLYTEAIARDPYYLYQFSNLLEEMHEDDDLSGSRFVRVMASPFGFNILIRPDAFFATFASLWEDAGYAPDGESLLGRVLRNSPFMVNPLVITGLNMIGAMGDTFSPDPVGANKFIQLAQASVDAMNARFGWGLPPLGNIQDRTLREVRDFVSGFVDPALPDWMAGHVPYSDGMAYQENLVRSIVAEIALERGMSLEDPLVQQAMIDPESELYQEALARSANQRLWDIGARILPISAVLYPKSQLASPKNRTLAIATERETAQQMGVGVTSRGEELYTERDLIGAATDYSRQMQIWEDEYQNMGSPESRGAYSLYNAIRYGNMEGPLTIQGQTFSADQINSLDDASREQVANAWAEAAGVAPMIAELQAERAAFREEHPEWDQFVTWRAQMGDYPGGVIQWWNDVSIGNPNAARWYNNLDREDQQNEVVLTSVEAYMAFQGEQMSYWDQRPIATRTAVDPTPYNPIGNDGGGSGNSSSSGPAQPQGPTAERITEQISQYQKDMEEYNRQVSAFFGQDVNMDGLDPMSRRAIESNLREAGIVAPRMGGYLYDYMQWAQMQAQNGGDTSISTYLRWYAEQNPDAQVIEPAA